MSSIYINEKQQKLVELIKYKMCLDNDNNNNLKKRNN